MQKQDSNIVTMRPAAGLLKDVAEIPLQRTSQDIWADKYRLHSRTGEPIEATVEDTLARVAQALAAVEDDPDTWYPQFLWALQLGVLPAGRIISNAGAQAHKPATSTINCTVSGAIGDSMDAILTMVHESGMTLKAGCGIGYEFSTLRPKGAFVAGAGAYTSGPLSFMDIFDKTCFTVSSAGGRRGAQMGTFDVSHPDVMDFIAAKREAGRLRQFNLSLLITQDFIEAVQQDAQWPLVFPLRRQEYEDADAAGSQVEIVWREWPLQDDYRQNAAGLVACKVYKKVRARRLWDMIMAATYDYAEPGFILIDKVNEQNNNWFCENIRATNPCGEQPLPPYGSCLLGSINLTRFVQQPFGADAHFDFATFNKVVAVFTRMLDNVVEIHGLPLPQQAAELQRKRRHGMGYLGLGSCITMLGMRYGDADSVAFTAEVSQQLALTGWRTGLALAQEKGPAPIMDEDFTVTASMLRQRPEMAADYALGDSVPGKVLLARYSRYMQKIGNEDPALIAGIAAHGARFTHHSSIAPTGTISLSLGNNASNGIEPSFAHSYLRNVIVPGKKAKEQVPVYSFELLAYRALVDPAASADDPEHPLPAHFVSADDISPTEHIAIQAAAQQWIDSSISKTANVPTDYPFEDFKDIYMDACRKGLKGCTTFRFNPEAFQGVLVKQEDLDNTTYQFSLDDGSVIEARGGDEVLYDGEVQTAANLHDALKDGYYGRL